MPRQHSTSFRSQSSVQSSPVPLKRMCTPTKLSSTTYTSPPSPLLYRSQWLPIDDSMCERGNLPEAESAMSFFPDLDGTEQVQLVGQEVPEFDMLEYALAQMRKHADALCEPVHQHIREIQSSIPIAHRFTSMSSRDSRSKSIVRTSDGPRWICLSCSDITDRSGRCDHPYTQLIQGQDPNRREHYPDEASLDLVASTAVQAYEAHSHPYVCPSPRPARKVEHEGKLLLSPPNLKWGDTGRACGRAEDYLPDLECDDRVPGLGLETWSSAEWAAALQELERQEMILNARSAPMSTSNFGSSSQRPISDIALPEDLECTRCDSAQGSPVKSQSHRVEPESLDIAAATAQAGWQQMSQHSAQQAGSQAWQNRMAQRAHLAAANKMPQQAAPQQRPDQRTAAAANQLVGYPFLSTRGLSADTAHLPLISLDDPHLSEPRPKHLLSDTDISSRGLVSPVFLTTLPFGSVIETANMYPDERYEVSYGEVEGGMKCDVHGGEAGTQGYKPHARLC